jgi:hypothetical protein
MVSKEESGSTDPAGSVILRTVPPTLNRSDGHGVLSFPRSIHKFFHRG